MLVQIVRFGDAIIDRTPRLALAYCALVGFLYPPTKRWQVVRRPIVTHTHNRWCKGKCSYRYTGEYASPAIGVIYSRHARTKFGALVARRVARGMCLAWADV